MAIKRIAKPRFFFCLIIELLQTNLKEHNCMLKRVSAGGGERRGRLVVVRCCRRRGSDWGVVIRWSGYDDAADRVEDFAVGWVALLWNPVVLEFMTRAPTAVLK